MVRHRMWLGSLALAILLANWPTALGARHIPTAGTEQRAAEKLVLRDLPFAAQGAISRTLGHEDPSYWAVVAAGQVRADNPVHQWTARFPASGVEVSSGNKTLGMRLTRLGDPRDLRLVRRVSANATANRIEYRRPNVTEWYVNGPFGLEQGFTIERAPAAPRSGPLTLKIAVSGDMDAVKSAAGLRLGPLSYGGLSAWDARSRELPARLVVGEAQFAIEIDDADAVYPVTVDPFIQAAKLSASDAAAGDWLGFSVAMSGNTIVVGSPFDDLFADSCCDHGSVYVFEKPETGWTDATQVAKLTAAGQPRDEWLGYSVAIEGDTIVAGALQQYLFPPGEGAGAVYVFEKPAGGWVDATSNTKLTASDGKRGDFFDHNDWFGASVAISGSTVVVGARQADIGPNSDQGAAYVFEKPAQGWVSTTETAKLIASDGAANDWFGESVAISARAIAAGAPRHSVGGRPEEGTVYVYERPESGWVNTAESATLTIDDGGGNAEFLGKSVAMSERTIVAGAPGVKIGANVDQGAAYVFEKYGKAWKSSKQTAKLTADDGARDDQLGFAVAIANSGRTIVAGAPNNDVAGHVNQGSAYVFEEQGAHWADATQGQKLIAADGGGKCVPPQPDPNKPPIFSACFGKPAEGDLFGLSLAITGDTIAVGAPIHSLGGSGTSENYAKGAVYVFVPEAAD